MKQFFLGAILFASLFTKAQKWEGLALTPPMGWNSWNTFQGNINEKLVMETADAMVSSGMRGWQKNAIQRQETWFRIL